MLKIFGERNTGTNYLTNLINKNLSINLLRGTAYRLFGFNKSELYKNLFLLLGKIQPWLETFQYF